MNHRFLSFRPFFCAAQLWLLAGILLSAALSRADEPTEKHRRMENRFLFVIDTASAMKSRANGVEEAVNGLLETDMKGELRKGDTIGLWTYNDRLNTDFPMEVWSKEKKDDILKEVDEHLGHLRYEKRAHLAKAMPAIAHVVETSERLTVIFIYDGTDLIKGTPFDKDINELQKHYAAEFRAAHVPFVTVLASRRRNFFDYTINYPSTVMVPHMADPLPPPETNIPPPIIASAPPPVEPAPPSAPNVQIVLSGADFAHKESPPPAANNVAATVAPAPAPTPIVSPNVPQPAEVAPIVQPVQTSAAPTPPAPVAATPAPAPIIPAPGRTVPHARETAPVQVSHAPPTPAKNVPIAPAVAAVTTGKSTAMFVIAFSLLTIAIALALLLIRRRREGTQPSLISQSIDRPR